MTDPNNPLDTSGILDAVKTLEAESPSGAEALYMAAMLAETPLPYDFALSVDGTPHNPALINPAAAFFAATAIMDPLVNSGLVAVDADAQIFQLKPEVRAALLETMTPDEAVQWAVRAIYGLNLILPDADPAHWDTVQWLLPHIQACRTLITDLDVNTAAANRVLHQTGFAFYHQQRYADAAEYLEAALVVDLALKGDGHPDIAADLEGLGTVYWAGNQLAQAEKAFADCVELQKTIFTEGNPATGPVLNSLAVVRQSLGRLEEAEATFKECLEVLESAGGPNHPSVASCLSNMALLYEAMNRADEALTLAERSLAVNRSAYGDLHPEVANDLNTLALLQERVGRIDDAEDAFRQSLSIREQIFGPDHPETAQAYCNLGLLLGNADRDDEAMESFDKGLSAYAAALGPHHPLMEPALEQFIRLLERLAVDSQSPLREKAVARLRAMVEKAG